MFQQMFLMLILPVVFGSTEQLQNATIKEVVSECTHPFINVGGWCLLIDPTFSGSWTAVRNYCLDLEADLVSLYDLYIFQTLVKHINSEGWPATSYWVGGTFSKEYDLWVWVDGSFMEMGTPFWGYSTADQYPSGSDDNDCAYLSYGNHYYMKDYSCGSELNVICHKQ